MNAITPKHETVSVPAGGNTITVHKAGRFLTVVASSFTSFACRFDNDAWSTLKPGLGYPCPEGFESVSFRDPAGAAGTIEIVIANDLTPDARYAAGTLSTIATNTGNTNASVGTANGHLNQMESDITDLLDHEQGDTTAFAFNTEIDVDSGAAILILAANANRRGCSIMAKADNAGYVAIGSDDTVTVTKWAYYLAASQGYTFTNYKGAIYGRASVDNQKIGVAEW